MGKRAKPRTNNAQTAEGFHDRISLLPDEILVMILSQLPITLAAQTSILSPRWRNLWNFTATFDFDCDEIPQNSEKELVHRLHQALESHRGPTLKRLGIRLGPVEAAGCHPDRWIDFAIRKSVQDLEFESRNPYFPPLTFSTFDSLKSLSLHYVDVNDKQVEYFLTHCPSLERVCLSNLKSIRILWVSSVSLTCLEVSRCPSLQFLNVSSMSLTCLEISCCFSLEGLAISASNLISFKYWGNDKPIMLHAPLLAEVWFLESYCSFLARHKFRYFLRVVSQLRTLKLTLTYPWMTKLPTIDALRNLNKLELEVKVWGYDYPFNLCTSVMEALPFLHKFWLHLYRSEYDDDESAAEKWVPAIENRRHHWLKVVGFVGFVGSLLDFEIIRFIAKNAVSLEKMSIRPCRRDWIHDQGDFMKMEEREEARKRAHQLGAVLSPHTQLIVL